MAVDISQLIADLADADPAKRAQAAEQLSHLGSEAQPATLALVRAAGDAAEEVKEWAVAALEDLGPPPVEQVTELAAILAAESSDVGYWAATLLGRLKVGASPAVPSLVAALNRPADLAVRQRAVWALGEIGPSAAAAVPSLRKAATDPDPRLARLAQQAIEQIGG